MMTRMAKIKTIDEAMRLAREYVSSGKSQTALAKAAGVHRNTISKIGPGWTPTTRTIRMIAAGLDKLSNGGKENG